MHTKRLVIGLGLSLCACGKGPSLPLDEASLPAISNFSVSGIYQEFARLPPAKRDASFAALKQLTFSQYFDLLSSLTKNATVSVNGELYQTSSEMLRQNQPQKGKLSAAFPNVGAYWQSLGLTSAAISPEDFSASVTGLLTGETTPALGLVYNFNPNCSAKDAARIEHDARTTVPQLINAMNVAEDIALRGYVHDGYAWVSDASGLNNVNRFVEAHPDPTHPFITQVNLKAVNDWDDIIAMPKADAAIGRCTTEVLPKAKAAAGPASSTNPLMQD